MPVIEKFYKWVFPGTKGLPFLMKTLAFSFFFVFSCYALSIASNTPEITVVNDRDEMRVGDRINVEVSSSPEKGVELFFSEKPENTGEFSFISSRPLKTGVFEKKREGRVYTYGIYVTGTHVLPPIEVLYREQGSVEWNKVLSRQVPVEVVSVLTPESSDIHDIKGIFSVVGRARPFLAWALVALGFIVLLAAWLRNRKKAAMEAAARIRPADEVAYEKLRELRAMRLPEKGLIKEYYIRLSEIVRYYLEGRFSFRAPEMTTEEFLDSLRGSPELKLEHKQLLSEFLYHCDMVKFAKYGPTPLEMLDSFSAAERLVDQTRVTEGGEGA